MDGLCSHYDAGKVFNDFLTMAICSFHQVNIQTRLQEEDQENEKLYMGVINSYRKDEINIFPKLLALLQLQVYDKPYSDILGEYFTGFITNGRNGQFFTPESVCEFMAKIQGEPGEIKDQTVFDPACGSGRMLLRFANHNHENMFFGADNDQTCAKMATLNFFLNGLQGEVAWMNSLSMEWFGGWHINKNGLGIIPIEKEQSLIWSSPLEVKKESGQLCLL